MRGLLKEKSGAIVDFWPFLLTLEEKNNNYLNILLIKKKCKND